MQFETGADREPPKPTTGEVTGGVLLLALAAGALLGTLLVGGRPKTEPSQPRAQLTAAVQPAPEPSPEAPEIEHAEPRGPEMLRPD